MAEISDEQYAQMRDYWAAYGRYIYQFSQVEQRLHSLLWEMSGVHPEVARAVFQDARFGSICQTINRINTSRATVEHPLYRRAIDQMGNIASVRNDLVHQPSALMETGGLINNFISNAIKAMPDKKREYAVDVQMLDDMCHDFTTIMACLNVCLIDTFKLPPDARELPWREAAQRAWQYKPAQQSGEARARRKRPQGTKSPPAPSPK